MKRKFITVAAALALTLGCLNAAAQSVTNAYTLTYEGLGLNNADFIPEPYPGISAAIVTHRPAGSGVPVPTNVFFWGGVSPVNGYGNLTNVAVGPSGADVFAGVVITPAFPGNHVRLISFDMATKDDGFGDVSSFNIYIQEDPYPPALTSLLNVTIPGDANNTVHTNFDFSASPVQATVNKGLAIFWEARFGRVAIDNVRFEVVGPPPPSTKMIVTLPGQTFTSGSGNSGTPAVQTAGAAFDLTLTAVNDSLEKDTAYNGTTTISYNGPGGEPAYTTSVVFTNGQATNVVTTLKKAETITIGASDGVLTGVASSSLTISTAGFTRLQVLAPGENAAPGTSSGKTGTPNSQDFGTTFNVTVNAVDAYHNLVSTAPNDNIHVATSDPLDIEPADNTLSSGTRTFGITPVSSGMLTVTATNTSNTGITPGSSSAITVAASTKLIVTLPGQFFTSGVGHSGAPTAQTAGAAFGLTLSAVNNSLVVDTSYNGQKTITYSGPGGSPEYTTDVTFTAGQATTVSTTLKKAETITISATDGVLTGVASSNLTVNAAGFTRLQVLAPGENPAPGTGSGKTGLPDNQIVGTPFNVTVSAVDANWNLLTGAPNDNIHVATSDPIDTEPTDNTLSSGTRVFGITPATGGTLIVTATNLSNGGITPGTSSGITVIVPSTIITQVVTLTYEGLGATNDQPIPDPYPGITAAIVTHSGAEGGSVHLEYQDTAFWGGVADGDRYGNLTNVAHGPRGTPSGSGLDDPAYGVISITPNYPGTFVRLRSFDIAAFDDGGGDPLVTAFVLNSTNGLKWLGFEIPVKGDFNNAIHTHVGITNGPNAIEGLVDEPLTIWWEAKNGRVAVDNVQFEIVGPAPEVLAKDDFYTVAQGATLTVPSPGVLANDLLRINTGPLTATLTSGTTNGTVNLTNNGGFAYTSTNTGGMDSFVYQANDSQTHSSSGVGLISVLPPGVLFYDDFARPVNGSTLTPWRATVGTWVITNGVLQGNTGLNSPGHVYFSSSWTDYSVEARGQLSEINHEWSLGGRLNPTTGEHYRAAMLPNGANWKLRLAKLHGWENFSGTPMVTDVTLPGLQDTGFHTLKLTFRGNRILVHFDGVQRIDTIDNSFEGPAYASGGITLGMFTLDTVFTYRADEVIVRQVPIATNSAVVTLENVATNLTLQGSVGGATKTFAIATAPTNGALSGFITNGAVTYTPSNNYSGPDAFVFSISDGTLFATGMVTITVLSAGENHAPVVANPIPSPQLATYGTAFSFQFAANAFTDPDGNPLSYTASGMPPGITFDGPNRTFSGTPTSAVTNAVAVVAADPSGLKATNTFSIEVARRAITVTAVTDTKDYDGTIGSAGVPTITAGILASGDTENWTQTFNNKNVGTGKTLTPAGAVGDGNGGNNYAVTFVANTAGVITTRGITVTAATDSKPYDGTTSSTATPTITTGGLAAGDLAGWTQTFDTKNVGTGKTLTPAGAVSDGNSGNNYAVSFVANVTGVITQAALTVTGVTANNKTYDATTTATLNMGGATLAGVVSGEDVGLAGVTSTVYDNSINDFNSRFELPSGLEIGDEITLAGTANGASRFSFEYWGVGGGPGGAFSGFVEVILRFYKNDGGVVAGVTNAAGAEVRRPGSLLFKSKPFPVFATPRSVLDYTRDGDFLNPAAADVLLTEALPSSFTWTVEFTGLGAGDHAGLDLYSPPVIGESYPDYWEFNGSEWELLTFFAAPPINFGARLEAVVGGTFADKNVGSGKAVTVSELGLNGADAGNYTLTQPTLTANITAKPLTVTGITANNKGYDGTTAAELNLAGATLGPGVISGDSITLNTAGAYGTFADPDVGTGKIVTINGLALTGADAGNYSVTPPTTTANIFNLPRLLSMSESPEGTFKMLWQVYPGRVYEFQIKTNLADAAWTTFGPPYTNDTSPSVEVIDVAGTNRHGFYRARDLDITNP